jgi:hypothetical protein
MDKLVNNDLAARRPAKKLKSRATIDNAIWGQEPRAVNAHIRELIEEREIFQDALSGEPENPPDAHEIPDQRSAASQFALDAEGRLDLLPDAPLADDLQREMYLEVRHKAAILAGLGHNQLADLSAPIDRFREALPVDITLISINRVWSRGNTLRRHLAAHELVVRSAEPVDPSRLTPVVGQMLRDLVDTFNVFIVGDPKGRELDQIRLGPRERAAAGNRKGSLQRRHLRPWLNN